MSKRSITGW